MARMATVTILRQVEILAVVEDSGICDMGPERSAVGSGALEVVVAPGTQTY